MNQNILRAIAEQIPTNRMITDKWTYTHRIAKLIYGRLELMGIDMKPKDGGQDGATSIP